MSDETTPEERAEAFMAAWHAAEAQRGPRTEHEPRGLAGVPGRDGTYHELMPEDVEALLAKARISDFAKLTRLECPIGTVLLFQPGAEFSRPEQLQVMAEWAEVIFDGCCRVAILSDAIEVRIIEGGTNA